MAAALGLPERLLLHLDQNGELDTYKFASSIDEDHQKVVGAVKCLQALEGVITAEPYSIVQWTLTEEGKHVTQAGSHEALVYEAIPPEGITKEELMKKVPPSIHTIGLSKAMAHGWIRIDKSNGKPLLKRKVENIKDIVQDQLLSFANDPACIDSKVKTEYKKRKLIQEVTTKSFKLGKGENFSVSISKPETDLTPEMIASGSWKDLNFKPYNFNALGVQPDSGALHPLLKVRAEFRQIFLEMGFTEMPTNNYVESSFWNFDALFQPQQHPARDAHDTFFVAEPKSTTTFPASYLKQVEQVHSTGGFGSQGYGYEWKVEEAQKNLLRTHTTAVSARMLYNLAQNGFRPAKYFSIDRVFRNETLDATHLAEFHQVEGVVADYKLTLGDLIGTLHEFFNKLGLKSLHFKPAYNPYTEPSMEIFSFHPGLNKFIEVGNSGIFRPEMLLPMGLPEDVNVIAWGLSLERPTMIKYGINNIRTLVGPKVDLQMVHASPLCRLEKVDSKENKILNGLKDRLATVISQLENLDKSLPVQGEENAAPPTEAVIIADPRHPPFKTTEKVIIADPNHPPFKTTEAVMVADPQHPPFKTTEKVIIADPNHPPFNTTEAVMVANPNHLPFCVIVMLKLLGSNYVSGEVRQTKSAMLVPAYISNLVGDIFKNGPKSRLNIRFIWSIKRVKPKLVVYPSVMPLYGEGNTARFLSIWIDMQSSPSMLYKAGGAIHSCQIDSWLDLLHGSMVFGDEKTNAAALRRIDSVLRQREWLVDSQPTIADLCWWSHLKKMQAPCMSDSLRHWVEMCDEHKLFALE